MTARTFFIRVFAVCVIGWTAVWLAVAAPTLREMRSGEGMFFFELHVNGSDVPVTAVTVMLMVAVYLLVPPALLAGLAVAVRAAVAGFANRHHASDP